MTDQINPSTTITSQAIVNNPAQPHNQAEVSSVKVTREPITCDLIGPSLKKNPDGSPSRETAHLRQVTYRHYPSGKVGNSLQDSLFDQSAFNFQDNKAESIRMAFVDVPVGTTREQVMQMINNYPDACIYQILSDKPILTDTQEQALAAGLVTLEDIMYGRMDENGQRNGGQVVRYGKSQNIPAGKGPQDFVPSPAGNIQFRQTFFSTTFKPDIDRRHRVPSLGATNLPANQASQIMTNTLTNDMATHEGRPTVSGSNPSAGDRSEAGQRVNDFQGRPSQGEQRANPNNPFGQTPGQFTGDEPDVISGDTTM
jgi:hypothetical protein